MSELLERHRWETRMTTYLFSALVIAAALTISLN